MQPRVSDGGAIGWDGLRFLSRKGGLTDVSLFFCAAAAAVKEKDAEGDAVGEMIGGKEGLLKTSIPILALPNMSPLSVCIRSSKQLRDSASPLTAFIDTDITGFSCSHNTRNNCNQEIKNYFVSKSDVRVCTVEYVRM